MAWNSEPRPTQESYQAWRALWAVGLVLCPISYLSLVLLRISPAAGVLAGLGAALLLLATVGSLQGHWRRLRGWEVAVALVLVAGLAGLVSPMSGEGGRPITIFVGLAAAAQLAFIWLLLPWLSCDVMGVESEAWAGLQLLPPPSAPPRSSLSFVIFSCFVLFGMGALWSRGEAWVPNPTPWLAALALLALGAMVQERFAFFARSARDGNLALPRDGRGPWLAWVAAVLLLAALLAFLGPYRHASPVPAERLGSAQVEAPRPPPPSLSQLEQQLRGAAAAAAAAVTSLRHLPRPALPLLLLLLLLLIAMILVWLFQRSRAAAWLLAAASWVIARLISAWRRLLSLLRKRLTPATLCMEEEGTEPEWVKDPLFDIFAHPELLAQLSPREIILRTYHLLLNYADMLGQGRRPGETALEHTQKLRVGEGAARRALQDLTWSYAAVMYGGSGLAFASPQAVREAWSHISSALTAHLSPEELAFRREAYLRG